MNCCKLIGCAAIGMALAAGGGAFAHEMPEAKLCTYLNGHLNLLVSSNDFTAVTAGISGDNKTKYSLMTFEVQVKQKGADDSTYVTVGGKIPDYNNGWEQRGQGAYFIWVSDALDLIPGCLYAVRARATATSSQETTDWREMGDAAVHTMPATSYRINSPGAASDWVARGHDGSIVTFYEDSTNSGKDAYFGWVFQHREKLKGVRYVYRSNSLARSRGAVFQVADDAGFTKNVRTVYTISTQAEAFRVYDITFTDPVECLAVRVRNDYCNFTEVEWYGFDGIMTDFASDDNCYPVFSWPIGETNTVTSHLESSYGGSSGWTQVGETMTGNGYFTVTNTTAVVGQPLYYRVAKSNDTYIGPISYTRPRRLDRDPSDETKLLTGNSLLECRTFATNPEGFKGESDSKKLFDGDTGTYVDASDSSYKSYEIVAGLKLSEAAHIVGVDAMPRADNGSRQSYMSIKAADGDESYLAKEHVQLAAEQATSAAVWYRYDSLDRTNLYTHVFGYCAIANSTSAWFGNTAEMRIYGWNASDEAAAGAAIATPTLIEGTLDDLTPSVSWTVSKIGCITNSQLQYAYQAEGPWTDTGAEQTTAGTFTNKLDDAKVGIETYYRVKYETVEGTRYTASVNATKPRYLERDTKTSTAVREGVTIISPIEVYAGCPEGTTVNRECIGPRVADPLTNVFDANTDSGADFFYSQSQGSYGNGINAVVGVKLPNAAHVVDAWLYSRNTRFKGAALYGAVTADDFDKTNIVELSASKGNTATAKTWTDFASVDVANTYQYVFFYGSQATSTSETDRRWYGDVNELYFIGWSDDDAVKAGAVAAPSDFQQITAGSRHFTWTAATNATKYALERYDAANDCWIIVADDIPATATSYEDEKTRAGDNYQYRLKVYGLDNKMIRATDVIRASIAKKSFSVIFR